MPLYYKDFAERVPYEKLRQELDSMSKRGAEKHLIAIANEIDDCESLGAALGLPYRDIEDAAIKCYHDPRKQRYFIRAAPLNH